MSAEILNHPDFWTWLAERMVAGYKGTDVRSEFDLADSSEATDAVQLICEELHHCGYVLTHPGDFALGWDSTMFVKDASGEIRKVVYE